MWCDNVEEEWTGRGLHLAFIDRNSTVQLEMKNIGRHFLKPLFRPAFLTISNSMFGVFYTVAFMTQSLSCWRHCVLAVELSSKMRFAYLCLFDKLSLCFFLVCVDDDLSCWKRESAAQGRTDKRNQVECQAGDKWTACLEEMRAPL